MTMKNKNKVAPKKKKESKKSINPKMLIPLLNMLPLFVIPGGSAGGGVHVRA